MDVSEEHKYAASALLGMAILGEGAIIFQMSALTVFYATLVGGVAGVYAYAYGVKGNE